MKNDGLLFWSTVVVVVSLIVWLCLCMGKVAELTQELKECKQASKHGAIDAFESRLVDHERYTRGLEECVAANGTCAQALHLIASEQDGCKRFFTLGK